MEVVFLESAKQRCETRRWLEEILAREPASLGEWRVGKVCQVCGEISTVSCWEEWVAAYAEGGEFIGFRKGHQRCSDIPPGAFSHRKHRFCEVCMAKVPNEPDRRVDLSWLCEACERQIRQSRHLPELVLDELGRSRFERYESNPAGPGEIDEGGFRDLIDRKPVKPPTGWLPPGLYRCEECGEIRGITLKPTYDREVGPAKSTCLCDGLICPRCGGRGIHRPTSNLYHLDDGQFWHFPSFARSCALCKGRG